MNLTSRMALAAASLLALSGIHCTSTAPAPAVELTPLAGTAVKGAPPAECLAAQEAALVFERVNSHLEAGGDFYMYGNMENLSATLGPWIDSLIAKLTERQFFDTETAKFQTIAARAKGFWPVLGYDAVQAFGMSSFNLGDDADPFYSTRQFFYTGDKPMEGLVWDFTGKNMEFPALGSNWPDNVCMVGIANPDFAAAHTRLIQAFPELKELESRVMFDIPGILQAISGPVEFMMVDTGDTGVQLLVRATDRGNMLYGLVAPMLSLVPGAEFTMDSLTIKIPDMMKSKVPFDTVMLKKGTDTFMVMTKKDLDVAVADRVAAGNTLAKNADFQRLSGGLPKSGSVFVYYSKDGQSKVSNWANPKAVTESTYNEAMASMISRQQDGLSTVTYSYAGVAEMQLRNAFSRLDEVLDQVNNSELLPAAESQIEENLE